MDEARPDEPVIQSMIPMRIFFSLTSMVLILIAFVLAIIFLTPVGILFLGSNAQELVQTVNVLNARMSALKDSIDYRDRQLRAIQGIIVKGKDTTFQVNTDLLAVGIADLELPEEEVSEDIKSGKASRMMNFEVEDSAEPFELDASLDDGGREWGTSVYRMLPVEPPVKGPYSREFSAEKNHLGLDIAVPEGTPVRALADGIVVSAEWTFNYGYVIYIQHPRGWISGFKHCTSLNRKAGDIVSARDIVGTAGNAGAVSSGPHLHVEIWQNGVPVDPARFFIQ
jgi:murein DD-endopeptidase MepM/ murein hydrolase activator NlpD